MPESGATHATAHAARSACLRSAHGACVWWRRARRVVVHGFSDTVCAEEGCRAANLTQGPARPAADFSALRAAAASPVPIAQTDSAASPGADVAGGRRARSARYSSGWESPPRRRRRAAAHTATGRLRLRLSAQRQRPRGPGRVTGPPLQASRGRAGGSCRSTGSTDWLTWTRALPSRWATCVQQGRSDSLATNPPHTDPRALAHARARARTAGNAFSAHSKNVGAKLMNGETITCLFVCVSPARADGRTDGCAAARGCACTRSWSVFARLPLCGAIVW